ncbi:MAG: Hsp20 family protein [Ignavibacteria bacterium]|nr:Hsp20 family protein [Ignavibacteria bacterium]
MRNGLVRRPTASILDDFFNDEFFLPSFNSNSHLDVYQEDNKYVVEVDLPGYKKEEINMSFNNDLLTIKAEHKEEKKEDTKKYIYRSRSQSMFTRQIRFNNIDHSTIDAKFEEGVLKVILPIRGESEVVKRIEVR